MEATNILHEPGLNEVIYLVVVLLIRIFEKKRLIKKIRNEKTNIN